MKLVSVISRDANDCPDLASVGEAGAPIAVVARKLPGGVWEPLYAIKRGSAGNVTQLPLPSCFSLNNEAYNALEAAK